MKNYQKTIDRALEHVRSQQSPDGGFISLSSFSPEDFRNAIPRRTTFFASNVLTCLQNIPGHTADVRDAAAKFLLGQKSERWSFNYWTRNAKEETGLPHPSYPPYPDDLDDTFAALSALVQHNTSVIDGHAAAAVAKLLIAREVREGGPYRTWLVGDTAPAAWQDVDLVVSSTIGYFLSLIGVRLSRLEGFIDNAVRENCLSSPYYPGIFHVGYFLSRFYKYTDSAHAPDNSTVREILTSAITARLLQNGGGSITPLEHAMVVTSLINLGHAELIPSGMIEAIMAHVEDKGFLPYAFCIDPARDGRKCYAGASALTAAVMAGALMQYSIAARHAQRTAFNSPTQATPFSTHDHIRAMARLSCRVLSPDLRVATLAQIEKTSDERITMLAYEFRDMLYKNGVLIPCEIVEQLSLANLYGWMAYEIYDDVLDGEDQCGDDPLLLPCANFFLRSLSKIYASIDALIPGARSLFDGTMNCIDGANVWEQRYCRDAAQRTLPRFGDHQTLADRSVGHIMGPLAELLHAGYMPNSREYKNVELFFRHYLIARQLHDDAHDWADDLSRDRVNSIGTLVLRRFKEKYPDTHNDRPPVALLNILPELRKIFWEEIIDDASEMIRSHITTARDARERSIILADTDFMECALRNLESGARRAIKERDKALVFLNDYKMK